MTSLATPRPRHARPGVASGIAIRESSEVTPTQRAQMFALLDEYYLDATRERFERDLDEKEWVVVVTDPATQRVRGFSTLMRVRATVDGERVAAFFSGDTVFRSSSWGKADTSQAMGRLLHHMLDVADAEPACRWYWFLISSTYRSYRLLPGVFREFHPSPRGPMPAAAVRILDGLAQAKGHATYDPRTSIIRYPNPTVFRQPVLTTVVDCVDPWENFFLRANPGHDEGDRLASLAWLSHDNLSPLGRRLVDRAERSVADHRSERLRGLPGGRSRAVPLRRTASG